MCVIHSLSRRIAHVGADGECVGHMLSLEQLPDLRDQAPKIGLLGGLQLERVCHMPARDNQCVPGIQREGVRNGSRKVGGQKEVASNYSGTERTGRLGRHTWAGN